MGVEETGGSILEVATAGIDFPRLGICKSEAISMIQVREVVAEPTTHAPELDQPVITSGHNQWQRWVERHPVDTTVMTFQHKLDNRIGVTEHVRLVWIGASHLILKRNRGRGGVLLPQAGDVPDADGLVQGGGGNEVFGGMELSTHHIVVVAGHSTDWRHASH